MITVELLGVDVYVGFIAFGIAMVAMVAVLVATVLDSNK